MEWKQSQNCIYIHGFLQAQMAVFIYAATAQNVYILRCARRYQCAMSKVLSLTLVQNPPFRLAQLTY